MMSSNGEAALESIAITELFPRVIETGLVDVEAEAEAEAGIIMSRGMI